MLKISANIQLPGDKSISHRSALFSALRKGKSRFKNFNFNQDCSATLNCLQELGISWQFDGAVLEIAGKYFKEWTSSPNVLNAMNSGTTARLLSGLLSNLPFETTLTGDASLQKRPMRRILEPLTKMGAKIESNQDKLPLKFYPVSILHGIRYPLPVASAQVKSAVLLAGLFAEGQTEVVEYSASRDHTERMLGLKREKNPDGTLSLFSSRENRIPDLSMVIPGDFSSAAFFIGATLVLPKSRIEIQNVSLNPTRSGLLTVLKKMGAKLEIHENQSFPEPAGTIVAETSNLINQPLPEELIANIIDEIPVLAVLGTQAAGKFSLHHARELRYKESDRIEMMVKNLRRIGVEAVEFDDGFEFEGPAILKGGMVETAGDHRIAMAFAIANLFADDTIHLDDPACVSVSFPTFWNLLKEVVR